MILQMIILPIHGTLSHKYQYSLQILGTLIHKYQIHKYANKNTQIEIHKYKIKIHKYKNYIKLDSLPILWSLSTSQPRRECVSWACQLLTSESSFY